MYKCCLLGSPRWQLRYFSDRYCSLPIRGMTSNFGPLRHMGLWVPSNDDPENVAVD